MANSDHDGERSVEAHPWPQRTVLPEDREDKGWLITSIAIEGERMALWLEMGHFVWKSAEFATTDVAALSLALQHLAEEAAKHAVKQYQYEQGKGEPKQDQTPGT